MNTLNYSPTLFNRKIISFIPLCYPGEDHMQYASSRIRCFYPYKALAKDSGYEPCMGLDEKADIFILQKNTNPEILEKISRFNNRMIVFDLTDPIWEEQNITDIIRLCHIVTVPTESLKSRFLQRFPDKICKIWEDCIDYDLEAMHHKAASYRGVVWFGNYNTIDPVLPLLKIARDNKFEISIITDATKITIAGAWMRNWVYNQFTEQIRKSNIALLGHGDKEQYKSNNKMITAIAHGLPAVGYNSTAYAELLNEHDLNEYIIKPDEKDLIKKLEKLDTYKERDYYLDKIQDSIWERYNKNKIAGDLIRAIESA